MPTRFVPDTDAGADIPGVDRQYYEKQVRAGSALADTFAFRLAAARAKDRARHELIRAIQKADDDARKSSFSGIVDPTVRINSEAQIVRSIDGVVGAPDDAIKL